MRFVSINGSAVAVFVLAFFFGSLSRVIENYPILFDQGDGAVEEGNNGSPIVWLELVDRIVKGDRTKWDAILTMPLIEFLNTIAFFKAKVKERDKRIEQAAAKGFNAYVVACLHEML